MGSRSHWFLIGTIPPGLGFRLASSSLVSDEHATVQSPWLCRFQLSQGFCEVLVYGLIHCLRHGSCDADAETEHPRSLRRGRVGAQKSILQRQYMGSELSHKMTSPESVSLSGNTPLVTLSCPWLQG